MATVPGTPMQDTTGGIPPDLQPGLTHFLMAAAIMHSQGKFAAATPKDFTGSKALSEDPDLKDFQRQQKRDEMLNRGRQRLTPKDFQPGGPVIRPSNDEALTS